LSVNNNQLTVSAVNHILVTLDTNGLSNGYCTLNDGTNAAPTGAGLTAITSLQSKGWYITTN